MPKRGRKSTRGRKRRRNQRQGKEVQRWSKQKKIVISLITVLGTILSVAGTLTGLHAYAAWRLSVSPTTPLKPSDPFSTPFVIKNEGLFSIHSVTFKCYITKVLYENNSSSSDNTYDNDKVIGTLPAGKSVTVPCARSAGVLFQNPLIGAEERLIISFQPAFSFWTTTIQHTFVTVKEADGNFRWLEQSGEE